MKRSFPRRSLGVFLLVALIAVPLPSSQAADRLIIGNVSRTLEQIPNYAASDKGFFAKEGIVGDLVLIGSTDTLFQALIAGHVQVAVVDPSAAINAIERGQTNSRLHEFAPKFFLDRYWGG